MSVPRVPAQLLDLALGYQRSQTLLAMIELGVPAALSDGPLTTDQIASRIGTHPLAASRLLLACVALGLLERDGDRFANSPATAQFLVPGGGSDLGGSFRRMNDASDGDGGVLARRLREWQPGRGEPAPCAEAEARALESAHPLALLTGAALAEAFEFSRHRTLLDLGAGTGAMSIALCARHPHLEAILLDRGALVASARRHADEAGLATRVRVLEADLREPLPDFEFDVALLANLLSELSETTTRALLRQLFGRLPSGGVVLLSGWMLDDDGSSPLAAVLLCLEDIRFGAPDVERPASVYAGWLEEAGFVEVTQSLYAPPTRFVCGLRP